ncbi:hypothetical protein VNO77_43052 [Canavalia gladiata]|uniref:Uncharacterized protein n=1 Tax=Canavalia gladiata TaxID=3824 RepID=A0AAN9JWE2_CANGL
MIRTNRQKEEARSYNPLLCDIWVPKSYDLNYNHNHIPNLSSLISLSSIKQNPAPPYTSPTNLSSQILPSPPDPHLGFSIPLIGFQSCLLFFSLLRNRSD